MFDKFHVEIKMIFKGQTHTIRSPYSDCIASCEKTAMQFAANLNGRVEGIFYYCDNTPMW